jgi:hypothetical protein
MSSCLLLPRRPRRAESLDLAVDGASVHLKAVPRAKVLADRGNAIQTDRQRAASARDSPARDSPELVVHPQRQNQISIAPVHKLDLKAGLKATPRAVRKVGLQVALHAVARRAPAVPVLTQLASSIMSSSSTPTVME